MRLIVLNLKQHYGDFEQNLETLLDHLKGDEPSLYLTQPLYLTGAALGPLLGRKEVQDFCHLAIERLQRKSQDASWALLLSLPYVVEQKVYHRAFLIAQGSIHPIPEPESQKTASAGVLATLPAAWYDDPVTEVKDLKRHDFGLENLRYHSQVNVLLSPYPSYADGPELLKQAYKKSFVSGHKRPAKGYRDLGCILSPAAGDGSSNGAYLGDLMLLENNEPLKAESQKERISLELPDDLKSFLDLAFKEQRFETLFEHVKVRLLHEPPLRKVSVAHRRPLDVQDRERFFKIPAAGLKKRLEVLGYPFVLLGLSGGMDSTMALCLAKRALEDSGQALTGLKLYYLLGFGSSQKSLHLARSLASGLDLKLVEIDMRKTLASHFQDIGQNPETFDVTYENAQARERTQILMDLANKEKGLVLGTGTLSEAALGWCTYNGDQASMYHVNGSLPKSLIPELLKEEADRHETSHPDFAKALRAVAGAPASPELVPNEASGVSSMLAQETRQITETILGPYLFFDYVLWHFWGENRSKDEIFENLLACKVFPEWTHAEIKRYLETFVQRFFTQQFKRRSMPDVPALYPVDLSTSSRMPGDMSPRFFQKEA